MASTNNQIIINDQIPIAKYYLVIVKLEFIKLASENPVLWTGMKGASAGSRKN